MFFSIKTLNAFSTVAATNRQFVASRSIGPLKAVQKNNSLWIARYASTAAVKPKKAPVKKAATKSKKAASKKEKAKPKKTKEAKKTSATKTSTKKLRPIVKIVRVEPISGRAIFQNSILAELKAEKLRTATGVKSFVTEKYGKLSDEERQKFSAEATKLKRAAKRKEKAAKLPPFHSAYILYIKDHVKPYLAANQGAAVSEAIKHLAQQWHQLTADERQVYTDKAAEAIKVYWEKKKELELEETKESSRGTPPFAKYYKESFPSLREEHPDLHPSQIVKIASQNWKTLDENEKSTYAS